MADPVTMMMIGSTALQAGGALAEGAAAKKAADFEADQLDRSAMGIRAAGTRKAGEVRRQGKAFESDTVAAMVAQGGATDDAGAIERLAKIGGETDYNVLATVYESETEAEGRKLQAKARRAEGKAAKRRGIMKAAGSALQGASSIYGKKG